MVFDTKVAILVLDDLPVWQKLNVTAFLASGIAAAAPDAIGEPYEDAAGRFHARLLGQPMLIFAADPDQLQRAFRQGIARNLTRAVYVRAMFSTGHDAAHIPKIGTTSSWRSAIQVPHDSEWRRLETG